MKIMISQLRTNSASRNYDRTSEHVGARCELCCKPLDTTHTKIYAQGEELILPEEDINAVSSSSLRTVPIGPDCLKKLRKSAKKFGFKIITHIQK